MSDPLSIAASIAGLAALTGKVFKTVIDYGKGVKDARMDVSILTTELRTLSGMLTNLSLLATSLEASTSNNFFSNFQLDTLKKIIKDLEVDLTKAKSAFEASKIKSALQKLKWPFSKDDMMKLVEEIRAHKATINLALSADTLETLIKCLKAQDDIRMDLTSTRDAIKVLQEMHSRVELNSERQKTHEYFLKINPQSQFETARKLRNSATGGWFIKNPVVAQWMAENNSRIWLTGIPGSGKTLLCGLLIEQVLNVCTADTILAFSFCDYKDSDTQALGNILSSIALQIALQKPEAFTRLQNYYNELHPASGLPHQVDIEKLSGAIADMCQLFLKVFLIVDGLDECINNERELTRGVAKLACSIPNLSIALFSRREVEITSELVPEYKEIEISAQTHDLEIYIDAEMTKRPTLSGLDAEESVRIKDTLISKANGMFRWVVCQLDGLEGLGKVGREIALNELPRTLNESYDRILVKVMSKRGRNIPHEIVRNTLHWVCYDSQGLSIAQICEALSIGLNRDRKSTAKLEMVDEKEIMTYCSSLLRKNLEGDRFELAHFTVEEYLNAIDEESTLRSFRYSKADAERSLAQVSLEHIMSPAFASRPVAAESEYEKVMQRGKDHPFYSYASTHWPVVSNTHGDHAISKLLRDLFAVRKRPYLQNWLIQLCVELPRKDDDEYISDKVVNLISFVLRRDLTSLHVAAMICSSSLCEWLLSTNMDANATTYLHLAPIDFALLGLKVFHDLGDGRCIEFVSCCIKPGFPNTDALHTTINTLLEHDVKVPAVVVHSVGKMALDLCHDYGRGSASPFLALLTVFPDECLSEDALELMPILFGIGSWKDTFSRQIIQAILNLDACAGKSTQMTRAIQLVSSWVRSVGSWDTYDHNEDQFLPILIQDADFITYVRYAAQQDRATDIERLIKDTRFEDKFKRTGHIDPRDNPLIIAATFDSADVARVLPQSKFDWLGFYEDVDTVWHVAARNGSIQVLHILLELETDIGKCLRAVCGDNTPLGDALISNCDGAASLLLRYCSKDPAFFQSRDNVLNCTVKMGSEALFHELISKGASPDTASSEGELPLHFVNDLCSDGFFEELVKRYDKDHVSQSGLTAFQKFIRRTLSAPYGTSHTEQQLASRLEMLAPTNHTVYKTRSKQHIWKLFCKELGTYGNEPMSAYQADSLSTLLRGLSAAGIVASFENQGHGLPMAALFEGLEVLEFKSGRHRWEASLLNDAYSILRPPPYIKDQPSTIAFLTRAIRQDDYPSVHWLLNARVPVHLRVNDIAPIEQACHNGSFQIFEEVLHAGEHFLGDGFRGAGLSLLGRLIETVAERADHVECAMRKLRFALDRGLFIDERCTHGSRLKDRWEPAIVKAARLGEFGVVDLLMAGGANIFAQDTNGWDIVKYSIGWNEKDLLQQLHDKTSSGYNWESRASFTTSFGLFLIECSVLHIAAAASAVEIIDYLFSNDLVEDADICTANLYTPLQVASSTGDVETIKCLVRHGASIDGVNTKQSRPIEIALIYKHSAAVEMFLKLGATDSSVILPVRTAFELRESDDGKKDGEEEQSQCELKQPGQEGTIGQTAEGVLRKPQGRFEEFADDASFEHSYPQALGSDMPQSDATDEPGDAISWQQAVEDCIRNGDLDGLQGLFPGGRIVDCIMPECGVCDALTFGVILSKSSVAVWLLSIGAKPTQTICNFHGVFGTLHEAVQTSITGLCLGQLLDKALESGYAWSDSPVSPLHLACLHNDVEALEMILDHLNANAERYCASISPWKEQDIPSSKGAMMAALTGATTPSDGHQLDEGCGYISGGVTALHCQAFCKDLPAATALVNAGADVNSLDAEARTPLILAVIASGDNCDLVELLIDHGALIDHKDDHGRSALSYAAERDFIHVARLLVERGASPEGSGGRGRNLMYISSKRSLRCFIYFYQHGCDSKTITTRGGTIFNTRESRILTYILNAGLVPQTDSEYGLNLISVILVRFGTRMARMLYRSLPKDGRHRLLKSFRDKPPYFSPLCPAILNEELYNALPWLLDEGIDIEREISKEGTALMYACSLGRFEKMKILVRRGARLDYVDSNGRYHSAILSARQYPNIIRWLLVERFQDQPKLASYTVVTNADTHVESHYRVWLSVLVLLLTMTVMVLKGLFSAYRSTSALP